VKWPFIAVCLPSRGVGHLRTVAGLLRETAPYPHAWYFAFGLPIPDSHNAVVRSALADERTQYLLLAEDDHLYPVGVLDAMLAANAPIVGIDYLMRNGPRCVIRDASGEPVLVGLGCTLIRRDVFAALPDPPFQVGTRQQWDGVGWRDTGVPEHAGGQDIFFCQQARAAGFRITVLDGWEVGHLELQRAGDHVNYGVDRVICHGGIGDLPWRPESRRTGMAIETWKSPSDLVIPFDTDVPGALEEIAFRQANGWVKVSASEAKPLVKAQEKAQADANPATAAKDKD
jgi:hypothetical protein